MSIACSQNRTVLRVSTLSDTEMQLRSPCMFYYSNSQDCTAVALTVMKLLTEADLCIDKVTLLSNPL